MDDKQLLELAAKAAGIDVSAGWSPRLNAFYIAPEQETGGYAGWNPLTDDGDALRLAVRLGLELLEGNDDGPCALVGYWAVGSHQQFALEPHRGDPYAATRRAIVRAAAAIQRATESGDAAE